MTRIAASGRASAASVQTRSSAVRSDRALGRKARRAGSGSNSPRALIEVPGARPTGPESTSEPDANSIRAPVDSPAARLSAIRLPAAAAIAGSASPRNPYEATLHNSSAVDSFDVACRSNAVAS